MQDGPSLGRASDTLLSAGEIGARVVEMGRQISADYDGQTLVAVVILRGAFVFASDLVRNLDPHLDVKMDFVRASSYGDRVVSSGVVELQGPDRTLVSGQHILIVEDVVDTGRTLGALSRQLNTLGVASLEVAALLSKDRAREVDVPVRYVGFHIPDVFVVGYGLDYGQSFRHLPDVRVLRT